ncbi:MAG TPA: hypothetical protein VGC92_15550 [Phenylobacterium sp.]|jgi:hypothetical protein
MDEERPPEVDAEYRVVHGPWPRWALQLGLARLAIWAALVVGACIALGAAAVWLLTRL